MKVTLVTIGDEILIGQILDTNSQWLSKQLYAIGAEVVCMASVGDTREAIQEALDYYGRFSDLIIFTGGLGPTKDDITKHTLAAYYEDDLVFDAKVYEHVKKLLEQRGIPVVDLHKQQAMLPSKAKVLFNSVGTAAGMWFETNRGGVVSLPGVPFEMKTIVAEQMIPALVSEFKLPHLCQKTLIVFGEPESQLALRLESFEQQLPKHIGLAYLPSAGRVRLRLSAKGENQWILETEVEQQLVLLKESLLGCVVEDAEGSILTFIQQWMKTHHQTLAVAESCTGGKIASEIVSVPGGSTYFKGGVVAYSAQMKVDLLGVSPELLQEFSVVSAEVAVAMVKGIVQKTQASVALAVTGNAGPTTDDTPEELGVVYVAVAIENEVVVEKFNFGQPREKVIEQAKNKAFELLKKEILKKSR